MPRKPLSFPLWLEAAIILTLLIVAVIEFNHDQWLFAAIFALTGTLFGAALAARLLSGDPDARK